MWSLVLHGCSSAGGVGTSGGGGETGGGESLAFNVTEAAHILEMKQLRWLHLDGGSTHASPPKWNVSVAIGRLTHLMFLELSGITVMSMPPQELQNLRKLLSLGIRASPAVRGESPSHAIQRWARVLDSVRGVKSLHTLMLDSNHIHTAAMPPDLFTELGLMRVVNLAGNALTSLPPSLIAHKGVEVLNIADNDLAWDRVPVTGEVRADGVTLGWGKLGWLNIEGNRIGERGGGGNGSTGLGGKGAVQSGQSDQSGQSSSVVVGGSAGEGSVGVTESSTTESIRYALLGGNPICTPSPTAAAAAAAAAAVADQGGWSASCDAECAPGCSSGARLASRQVRGTSLSLTDYLGNGLCDAACNNANCMYDHGDCQR